MGFTLCTTGKLFGLGLNISVTVPTGARSLYQVLRMLEGHQHQLDQALELEKLSSNKIRTGLPWVQCASCASRLKRTLDAQLHPAAQSLLQRHAVVGYPALMVHARTLLDMPALLQV